MNHPVSGVRLGIDVGSVRVGVARSDPAGILATPVATVRRDPGGADLTELVSLIEEFDVVEIVVGLPRTLRGTDGPAVEAARRFADELTARLDSAGHRLPVEFVDERLTSVVANRMLADRGVTSRGRREIVDQAAAVAILQSRLDGLRR